MIQDNLHSMSMCTNKGGGSLATNVSNVRRPPPTVVSLFTVQAKKASPAAEHMGPPLD